LGRGVGGGFCGGWGIRGDGEVRVGGWMDGMGGGMDDGVVEGVGSWVVG